MKTSSEIAVLPGGYVDDDEQTRFETPSALIAAHEMTPKLAFLHHWRSMRKRLVDRDEPGLAIFVVGETTGLLAHDWIHGAPRVTHRIVGRHHLCDLRAPSIYGALALRHLAFMVRIGDDGDITFRVRDLFTNTAFTDEADRTLFGLDADGPLLLRAGGVHVIVLKTPMPELPEDPDAAWSLLPERVFTEGVTDAVEPQPRVLVTPSDDAEHTNVTGVSGPMGVALSDLLADGEAPLGVVKLRAGDTAARCEIGATALARGVLIGRYHRCALGADWGGTESPLSRVHLLLHRWGDELYAFDTSSTNGTWRRGEEYRRYRVEDGLVLKLSEQVKLTWHQS